MNRDPLRAEIRELPKSLSLRHSLLMRLRRHFVIRELSLRDFDRQQCLFVHVPKTAGMSVASSLFGHRAGAHLTFRHYRRIFEQLYGVKNFDEFFSFAFVRNPWDRCHSAYSFLKSGGILPQDRRFAEQHLHPFDDFGSFVRHWLRPENIYMSIHLKPQSYFLVDEDGEVRMHFIGRFENLETDYEFIRQRLGFGKPLAKANVTKDRRNYLHVYNDESRDIVGRVYAEDIERFKYRFE